MTLGELRNAIDALIQQGLFKPDLPAHELLPQLGPPLAETKRNPEETDVPTP